MLGILFVLLRTKTMKLLQKVLRPFFWLQKGKTKNRLSIQSGVSWTSNLQKSSLPKNLIPPKSEKSGCGQSSHQPSQHAVGGVWVVPSPGNMHGSSLESGEPILPAETTGGWRVGSTLMVLRRNRSSLRINSCGSLMCQGTPSFFLSILSDESGIIFGVTWFFVVL